MSLPACLRTCVCVRLCSLISSSRHMTRRGEKFDFPLSLSLSRSLSPSRFLRRRHATNDLIDVEPSYPKVPQSFVCSFPDRITRGITNRNRAFCPSPLFWLAVLELMRQRAHTQARRFRQNRRPPDHPLPRLRQGRGHVFRCLERRHLRVERDQPDEDGARSSWGAFIFFFLKRLARSVAEATSKIWAWVTHAHTTKSL